jgi:hypothetical protein
MIFELFYYSFIALVIFQAVLLLQEYLQNRGIVSTASTADSKSAGRGSNPRSSAKKRKPTRKGK